MALSPADYVSMEMAESFRLQAWRVWAAVLAATSVWMLFTVLPAILSVHFGGEMSEPLYRMLSHICHQIDERSFHYGEAKFGVCSRCFGVYFGLAAGTAIYPLWRSVAEIDAPPRIWLFLSVVPMSIDWALTAYGIWDNTQVSRFVTGLIVGVACATFIIPAVAGIRRDLSRRN